MAKSNGKQRAATAALLVGLGLGVRMLNDAEAAAEQVADVPARKWLHVANEGEYSGHADGKFALTRAVFESFIANLRSDPRYKAGADGVGEQPVIPFDYEHASELDPTSGTIPMSGAGAPAWTLDLKVEDGPDGKAQLWAYAQLGDKIRAQIKAKEYLFTSIAFVLESSDPSSAAKTGPKLTSIAFTNHPFLRDLIPLAARAQGLRYYYGDRASGPDEALKYTREILGLPAIATNDDVLGELTKVTTWAANPGTAPAGVPLDDVIRDLRCAWGTPITSTPGELLELATKAARSLIQTQAAAADAPGGTAAGASTMSLKNVGIRLKACRPTLLLASGIAVVHALGDDAAIEEAAGAAAGDSGMLGKILEAAGFPDGAAFLAKLPELLAAKGKVAELAAQLDEALSMGAQIEQAVEGQDVAAAMSAKGYSAQDKTLTLALTITRKDFIEREVGKLTEGDRKSSKKLGEARKAGRLAFFAEYGVPQEGQDRLLTNILAAPGGTQLAVPQGGGAKPAPVGSLPLANNGAGGVRQIDLSNVAGPNTTARLMSWVKAQPGNEKLTHDQAHDTARKLRRDPSVAIIGA